MLTYIMALHLHIYNLVYYYLVAVSKGPLLGDPTSVNLTWINN